jgi:small redox-active disulfide protein 2
MKKINIKVLGSGCPTCKTLYSKVLEVTQKIDPNLEVEYITDIAKIVELGAMSSPVFAIDGKIITAGKIPDEDDIKNVILEKLNS